MELSARVSLMFYGPEMINAESLPIYPSDYASLPLLRDQMIMVMDRCDGVGLAAPQIGIFKQLVIVMLEDESILELVNPEITRMYGKELEDHEGCLSLPPFGNECLVPRLEYIDIEAGSIDYPDVKRPYKFARMNARVVQHELDHLTGTFFIDRVSQKRRRLVLEQYTAWKEHWERSGKPFPFGGVIDASRSSSTYSPERYLPQVRFYSEGNGQNGTARRGSR